MCHQFVVTFDGNRYHLRCPECRRYLILPADGTLPATVMAEGDAWVPHSGSMGGVQVNLGVRTEENE